MPHEAKESFKDPSYIPITSYVLLAYLLCYYVMQLKLSRYSSYRKHKFQQLPHIYYNQLHVASQLCSQLSFFRMHAKVQVIRAVSELKDCIREFQCANHTQLVDTQGFFHTQPLLLGNGCQIKGSGTSYIPVSQNLYTTAFI